jgi:hypothetical protein
MVSLEGFKVFRRAKMAACLLLGAMALATVPMAGQARDGFHASGFHAAPSVHAGSGWHGNSGWHGGGAWGGAGWRGGNDHWYHGWHGGSWGWWYVDAGLWSYYAAYPYWWYYPTYYDGYWSRPYGEDVAPAAPAVPPQPAVWYYCDAARAYYPNVASCPSGWRTVPATPPPGNMAPAPH